MTDRERLLKIMKDAGYNFKTLADEIGVSYATCYKTMNIWSKPQMEMIQRIAKALGREAADILAGHAK